MHISLPKALQEFVESRYQTGRYSSKSEIVHEGLRRLMEDQDDYERKLSALRQAIQEGIESGGSEPLDIEEIIAEVEAEEAATDKMSARKKSNG